MTLKRISEVALLLCLVTTAQSQEPAFFSPGLLAGPMQAIRYEQNAGVFHYIVPCKQFITPEKFETEIALCWPVSAIRLRMQNGKFDFSPVAQGVLTVSATQVRFIPLMAKDMELEGRIPVTQAHFSFNPGDKAATIGTSGSAYKFGFTNICVSSCSPDIQPLDPSKTSQLQTEYSAVSESLKRFDDVYKRTAQLALRIRFSVDQENQPTTQDIHAPMALYHAVNNRFATICPEPAKSCIEKYASYQGCESADSAVGCGVAPSCTVVCSLPPQEYEQLQAGVCESASHDSATLFPFWNEVFKKQDSEQPAPAGVAGSLSGTAAAPAGVPAGVLGAVGMAGRIGGQSEPGWISLAGMSGGARAIVDVPNLRPPDTSCSPAQIYKIARSRYAASARPFGGVLAGTPAGTALARGTLGSPSTRITISPGIMAGNKLSGASPVYPTIAKAGRIQGTVVLQAKISKAGIVEDLQIISGPPLLQKAAFDAVKTWTYRPYLLAASPVEVQTTVYVVFALNDAGPAQPVTSKQ